jgi:UTP--glucose-1-phosphate uridylyltransferase
MAITTALISAAGYGSRFFPVSKSVQKEMLPVLNRPVLDYLVDDCIAAGISHIILIVREGQDLVRHYYTEQPELRTFFEQMGSAKKYEAIENLHHKARFSFITQRDVDGYGTAVPVKLARQYLEDEEAFLFLTGDDFMYHPEGGSEAADLAALWEATKASAVMSAREVEEQQVSRYGIIETEERDGHRYMRSLIEKPALGSTTSRLANISKYVLTPALFPLIEDQEVDSKSGELYITDSLIALSKANPIAVHVPRGDYLDCGTVASWLKANLRIAKQDPALWEEIKEMCS